MTKIVKIIASFSNGPKSSRTTPISEKEPMKRPLRTAWGQPFDMRQVFGKAKLFCNILKSIFNCETDYFSEHWPFKNGWVNRDQVNEDLVSHSLLVNCLVFQESNENGHQCQSPNEDEWIHKKQVKVHDGNCWCFLSAENDEILWHLSSLAVPS